MCSRTDNSARLTLWCLKWLARFKTLRHASVKSSRLTSGGLIWLMCWKYALATLIPSPTLAMSSRFSAANLMDSYSIKRLTKSALGSCSVSISTGLGSK